MWDCRLFRAGWARPDLTRRREATKKKSCSNGSPLPFQTAPRMRRIHANRKAQGRVASPRGPKIQARMRRLPPTQILPQSRRDAEEGILEILGILPRRAEIRVSQELTRKHEATKKICCSNGSPLPIGHSPRISENGSESKSGGATAVSSQASGTIP
jgi:hypothetical protein